METAELKQKLLSLLNEGKEISVQWNCGGDEALVSVFINGQPYHLDKFYSFEIFIIQKLELPSAGEFSLKGGGRIQIEDNTIVITYSSAYSYFIDYDEEAMTEIFSQEEQSAGKEVLMEI